MTEEQYIKTGTHYIKVLATMGMTDFSREKLEAGLPYTFDIILGAMNMPFNEFGTFDFSIINAYRYLDEQFAGDISDVQKHVVAAGILNSLHDRGIDKATLNYLNEQLPDSYNVIYKMDTMSLVSTQACVRKYIEETKYVKNDGDNRYRVPKTNHGVAQSDIDEAIFSNPIYSELREMLLNAQRGQVGYGLAKYPETLNKDSWSTLETLNHIIEESVDQLHYLIMLKQKLAADVEDITNGKDLNKQHGELIGGSFREGLLKTSHNTMELISKAVSGDNLSSQMTMGLSEDGQDCDGDKMLARKGIM